MSLRSKVKSTSAKQEKIKRQQIVEFTLKVSLSNINEDAVNKKLLKTLIAQLADKNSKAWSLVRESYYTYVGGYDVGDVLKEEYIEKSRVRITLILLESFEDDPLNAVNAVNDNYGDSAADTWMGGDILFDEDHEIMLKLVGKPRIIKE